MKNTSGDILEFGALKELIGRYVASPGGRVRLDALTPHGDATRLPEEIAEAGEAVGYLRAAAQPKSGGREAAARLDFSGLPDLEVAVQKLRIEGAVLDPLEVYDLVSLLDRASGMRASLLAAAAQFPKLGRHGAAIGDFRPLVAAIAGKILPGGLLADDASPELARLRRDIGRQKQSIQSSLERFLRAHQEGGVLQEEFVTIRNDRYVVPVIAGQKRKVEGVIHGASSTGHTLFVEPLATIELNNELVRLTEEEAREAHRIVREMTAKLREAAAEIAVALETLGALDFLFAKARFAAEFDCCLPRFSAEGTPRLLLREARHPLLEDVLRRQRRRIVPVTLELDRERRTLVISGPNTGGKTVSLKTAGLLALMAHAGLPVPCSEAEFPVFEQVLADIGDNQSIEQSLSTFSAHVARIRDMVLDGTADSLVLFDELGAATDPEEGGALGVAVVDHFRRIGAFTIASTHLMALKVYGSSTEHVVNGSMGFDEATLEPTYELRLGLPGKSAGLDIASRLGLPAHLMDRAREAMGSRERDLERLLAELHDQRRAAAALDAELGVRAAALVEREAKLAADWERRGAAKLRELEKCSEEALARFEAEAAAAIERIGQLAQSKKAASEASRIAAKVKRELRESFESGVKGEAPRPVPQVEPGARVRLKNFSEPATVRRLLGGGRLEVEAGILKVQADMDDVLEVLPAGGGPKLPANVSFRPGPQLHPAHQEINVIGEHADDACERVDRFLDQAVMATASRVRIVHGHGMGILRKAIWKLLGEHPHVAKFYYAPQYEGGQGATIVEIREE